MPEGFRLNLPTAQDLMPPMQLQQAEQGGAPALSWAAQPSARAFFVAGMGLIDYQTHPAVDRWLKDTLLLKPGVTRCTVLKAVFTGEGAMLRAIAYGHELNLAHPPRPNDPTVAWEPQWTAKVRVKPVASALDILRGVIGR